MHASAYCRVHTIFEKNLLLYPAGKKKIAEDGSIIIHHGRTFDVGSATDPGGCLIQARGSKVAEPSPLERPMPCCGVLRHVAQSNSTDAFLKVL